MSSLLRNRIIPSYFLNVVFAPEKDFKIFLRDFKSRHYFGIRFYRLKLNAKRKLVYPFINKPDLGPFRPLRKAKVMYTDSKFIPTPIYNFIKKRYKYLLTYSILIADEISSLLHGSLSGTWQQFQLLKPPCFLGIKANVFCFLSSLPLLPPANTSLLLPVISLLLTNSVSRVRTC